MNQRRGQLFGRWDTPTTHPRAWPFGQNPFLSQGLHPPCTFAVCHLREGNSATALVQRPAVQHPVAPALLVRCPSPLPPCKSPSRKSDGLLLACTRSGATSSGSGHEHPPSAH